MKLTSASRGLGQRSMMLWDTFALAVSWTVAFLIVGPLVLPDRTTAAEIALATGMTAAGLLVAWFSGLYTGHVGRERTNTAVRCLGVLSVTTLIAALLGVAANLAARELAVGIALMWTITILGRAFLNARIRVRRAAGKNHDRILVVGTNHEAAHFIELVELYPELGLDPVGVVGNAAQASIEGLGPLYRGPLLAAARSVQDLDARFAIVITGAIPRGQLSDIVDQLQATDVELMLSADLGRLHHRRLRARSIGAAPTFLVGTSSADAATGVLKRLGDIFLACLILVLTAPLQLLAAAAIVLSDRGPILYRQLRLGADGVEFEVLRFRTMRNSPPVQADNPVRPVGVWDDPRMTFVGRLLEISGVNEIPQLWNVLRGEMSMVGPKAGYVNLDKDHEGLAMRPGLTGLWRTEANLYPTNAVRYELDDIYMQNWSLRLDVGVLVGSIELMMVRVLRGASWRHAGKTESYAKATVRHSPASANATPLAS